MSDTYDGENRRAPRPEPWHLKKEINVSLIIVLLGQLAVGVWWIADFNAWRHETDRIVSKHDQLISEGALRTQDLTKDVADRLARIETKLDNLRGK